MIDPALIAMMPLTVLLTPPASSTGFGSQKNAGTTLSPAPHCSVEYKSAEITGIDGKTVHQDGLIYLDGVYPVDTGWSCVIPIPGGTKNVKIIGVKQFTDEVDYYNTVISFGAL